MIIVQRSVQGTVVLRSPAELPLSSWCGHKKTRRWNKIGRWWWWCREHLKMRMRMETKLFCRKELCVWTHGAPHSDAFNWVSHPCSTFPLIPTLHLKKKPSASASEEIGILNLRLWMIFAGFCGFSYQTMDQVCFWMIVFSSLSDDDDDWLHVCSADAEVIRQILFQIFKCARIWIFTMVPHNVMGWWVMMVIRSRRHNDW